jgi:hypothetical protein
VLCARTTRQCTATGENGGLAVSEFLQMAALITFVVTVTGLLLAGVIHLAVTMGPLGSTTSGARRVNGSSDDGHGAARAVNDSMAHRAEQHPLVGASASRAHHDEVGTS